MNVKTRVKTRGRFLSNIYDPRKPDAERYMCYSHHAQSNGPGATREEWQHHMDWINKNIIGPPKPTQWYTESDLMDQSMVGIYVPTFYQKTVKRLKK